MICCLPFFVCTDTEKIDLYPEAFKLVVYVKTITQQGQIYLLPFTAANKISAKIIKSNRIINHICISHLLTLQFTAHFSVKYILH